MHTTICWITSFYSWWSPHSHMHSLYDKHSFYSIDQVKTKHTHQIFSQQHSLCSSWFCCWYTWWIVVGLVIVTSYVYGQTELPSTTFLYNGGEQLYIVPRSTVQGQTVAFVQIKAWGAGGGSGCGKQGSVSQVISSEHSHGGGGGYAQGKLLPSHSAAWIL